ncbi:MAG: hypothetical protein JWP97_1773 [Labilithrix sp.]|nr:hypothetical protein [Labilithrix sp.]
MRPRLGLSVAWGLASAAAFYALLRLGQRLLFAEPDPALVLWSDHAGYFWRALTAAYLGGMVGFLAWLAGGRAPERVARALARALPVLVAIAAAQAVLVP